MDKRRERFLNYGVRQVEKAILNIDRLKRFAETSNYVTEQQELKKITDSLKEKVFELEEHYFGKTKPDNAFSLSNDSNQVLEQKRSIDLLHKQEKEMEWFRSKWAETMEQNQILKYEQKQIHMENDNIQKQIKELGEIIKELKKKLDKDQ